MNHTTRVYNSIVEMLPGESNPSPMVRLNRLPTGEGFPLFAKLEWMNPFGSVKDRAAYQMLIDLEESGSLSNGKGIVEPTSGNTGISLAGLGAALGHPVRAVVPERVPDEKKAILRILGAELDIVADALCPMPGQNGGGTINLAKTHAKAQPDRYVMPNQYENQQNAAAHYRTTGPEIWRQTEGKITHLFVSLGTCGTVTGTSRFLKEKNPEVKVIAVQPSEGHDIPGLRNTSELDVSALFDPSLIDEIVEIPFELAYARVLDLCRKEGLLAGPSSGLILEGALRAQQQGARGLGVMIFPDGLFKYVAHIAKHIEGISEEGGYNAVRSSRGAR
ncbi:MAG TPA: cysteine synthase family protein [Spirochaetia bacterium]|nr:cysteine synthase family protein [Spirochaetia bacterium]